MQETGRRILFIDKDFQAKFIIKFCIIVILSSLLIGAALFFLSRNFTTVAIEKAQVIVKSTSDFMLPIVIETIVAATVFAAVAVIILTLFVSHKISGPLYRLKKEIDLLKDGDLKANFKTRKSDQLQELANSLYEMGKTLGDRHIELKNKTADLKACLQNPDMDRNTLLKKMDELEKILSYFRI